MAKEVNENASVKKSGGSKAYIIGAIALPIFITITMVLGYILFSGTTQVYRRVQLTNQSISQISDALLKVNRNVLMIVSGTGDSSALVEEITNLYDEIEAAEAAYEKIEDRNEYELKRYEQAKAYTTAFDDKILEYQDLFAGGGSDFSKLGEQGRILYQQELYPLMISATEMFNATRSLTTARVSREMRKISRYLIWFEATMVIILVAGEVTIFIVSRVAKRNRAALEKREAQVAAFDTKLQHSKEKLNELTNLNILTNMKNRYALEDELAERLESDQFNVAVFDMDNFRIINDTYGYEFGDEYLVQIADKLNAEFSDVADLYNITGNEFCMVFHNDISESQALRVAQNVIVSLNNIFTILNIGVQLTASGAIYHYLPGECLNVASLLMRLDNVMRNVKMNGGNALGEVTAI